MFSPTCFQKKTFKHLSNALLQKGCIMESISSLQIQVRYHTIEIFIVRKRVHITLKHCMTVTLCYMPAIARCLMLNDNIHAKVIWQHLKQWQYFRVFLIGKNSAIIYSPSCLISFIYFFSLQWKSMVTKTWSWLPTFLKITLFCVFHRRKENDIGLEWLEGE